MRFHPIQPTVSGGIDLHVAWMDRCGLAAAGEGRAPKPLRTEPTAVLQALPPSREDVVGCGECRSTWSWRADRCEGAGLPFVLGHARATRASHGGTAQNDRIAAHKIAALRRGGLMPPASVYPRRRRAPRDLLRRTKHLLPKRAERSAPSQKTASRATLRAPVGRRATPRNRRGLSARGGHRGVQQNTAADVALGGGDARRPAALARSIEQPARGHAPGSWAPVRTMPGVGHLLALGLRSEREQIARCPRLRACVASGRSVKRATAPHGNRSGPSGKKLGHAPLPWAFSGAAGLLRKHHAPAPTYLAARAPRRGQGKARPIRAPNPGRAGDCTRTQQVAVAPAECLATSGGRARTRLAPHGSPGGRAT